MDSLGGSLCGVALLGILLAGALCACTKRPSGATDVDSIPVYGGILPDWAESVNSASVLSRIETSLRKHDQILAPCGLTAFRLTLPMLKRGDLLLHDIPCNCVRRWVLSEDFALVHAGSTDAHLRGWSGGFLVLGPGEIRRDYSVRQGGEWTSDGTAFKLLDIEIMTLRQTGVARYETLLPPRGLLSLRVMALDSHLAGPAKSVLWGDGTWDMITSSTYPFETWLAQIAPADATCYCVREGRVLTLVTPGPRR